jgi:acyl carrier protein
VFVDDVPARAAKEAATGSVSNGQRFVRLTMARLSADRKTRTSTVAEAIAQALRAAAPDEIDVAALDPSRPLGDQLAFDSIDFLNFVFGLERRFGISVPDDIYPRLVTLEGCNAWLATAGTHPEAHPEEQAHAGEGGG